MQQKFSENMFSCMKNVDWNDEIGKFEKNT